MLSEASRSPYAALRGSSLRMNLTWKAEKRDKEILKKQAGPFVRWLSHYVYPSSPEICPETVQLHEPINLALLFMPVWTVFCVTCHQAHPD